MTEIIPKFTTYEEIFNHYAEVSSKLISQVNGKILKTDCYNETLERPIAKDKSITLIEYQQGYIEKAKEINPTLNIVKGDIRKLPFSDSEFSLILDLSTIDHILPSEAEKVIKEYHRVLKPQGKVLIITWFADLILDYDQWDPERQYYFNYDEFRHLFKQYFNLQLEEMLFKTYHKVPGDCDLWEFRGIKK